MPAPLHPSSRSSTRASRRASSATARDLSPNRHTSATARQMHSRSARGERTQRRSEVRSWSSRNLERLFEVVGLLRNGVDDFHLQQVVARRERALDLLELNRIDDRVLSRSRRAGERQRGDVGERTRNRRLQFSARELELDLNLRQVRGRIDSRIVQLYEAAELVRG